MSTKRIVLVIGPAANAQGGISSVIKAHQATETWGRYRCDLIETYCGGTKAKKLKNAISAYGKFLRKVWNARLVHVHLAGQNSLLRKLPMIAFSKLLGKPVVLHVHAYSPDSLFKETPGWAVRCAFRSSQQVIALSPTWGKFIQREFPEMPISVVPNPTAVPAVVQHINPSQPTVLFVGKLEPRKGYSDLIKAAKQVLEAVPDARFILAGHGEVEQALKLASSLGISHAVECRGWVDRSDLPNLLNGATVFCLPSYNEGVPMAVLEAMSYALPVVTTPVGGIPDVITHQSNGILVPPGDHKSLGAELVRLLQNKNGLQQTLGEAARQTVQQLCSPHTVERGLATVYDSLAPC